MKLFCFGFGYSAAHLAHRLATRDIAVAGTKTHLKDAIAQEAARLAVPIALFGGDSRPKEVADLLAGTTHVLVSIPPDLEGDVVLRHFSDDLASAGTLAWIGYLSTIGVYGDTQGRWVDEDSPANPVTERSMHRLVAERAWLDFGRRTGKRVEVFRLPGIYGPGRSVVDNLRAGTARRIVKPGQVFNRIHVEDIAQALDLAMTAAEHRDVYNICDDEPAPAQDVVAFAAELLGVTPPPEIPFEKSGLGPGAASFYGETKRVRNIRMKQVLGVKLAYPTYREGIRSLVALR